MLLSQVFGNRLLHHIHAINIHKSNGRPQKITNKEALHLILKVGRTGMQWREVDSRVASYHTVFRRMQMWTKQNVFENAYKDVLRVYKRIVPTQHYCVDSSYVKNQYDTEKLGQNHTDIYTEVTRH